MEITHKVSTLCEICGESASNMYFKCLMYLCDSCFKFIHEKNKNKNHTKEKINYFIPISLKCPEHPKDRISLFCLDEKSNNKFYNFYRINMLKLLL